MRPLIVIAVAAAAALSMIGADTADAKRLGGGGSIGTQRSIAPTAPAASAPSGVASNPVMPATPGVAAARPAAPAAAAPSGASRWLGPIAGIAAGLGLAALLSHFGLSESFASLLLVGLLVVAGIFVIRLLFARKTATPSQASPFRFSSATGAGAYAGGSQRFRSAADFSAPDVAGRIEPTWGTSAAAPLPAPALRLPEGFDPVPFLEQAKVQFRRLQAAHDGGDRAALANLMTSAMFREVARDLEERSTHIPTDVVALDADILDVATEGGRHVASVRFSGATREDGATEARPFVEIWNLEKPVDGSTGWLLAGIQQVEENAAAQ